MILMKKILIKLSGEALSENGQKYSERILKEIADKIKHLQEKNFQILIVVGGGNLFRGAELSGKLSIERPSADYIGMLATVQNALVLRDFFESEGIATRVSSAIAMPQIAEPYIPKRAERHILKNRVVIFAGGIGYPFFSTDSAAVQRALELEVDYLIMAKNGVDGVYDSDPKQNQNAKKFDEITASKILSEHLKIADMAAISLARDNDLKIIVVSLEELDKIDDENKGTKIIPT